MNPKLQAFLYILMRDEVVPGVLEKIIRDLEHSKVSECNRPIFSNRYLADYADELVRHLTI